MCVLLVCSGCSIVGGNLCLEGVCVLQSASGRPSKLLMSLVQESIPDPRRLDEAPGVRYSLNAYLLLLEAHMHPLRFA